jgi:hypothetical protein
MIPASGRNNRGTSRLSPGFQTSVFNYLHGANGSVYAEDAFRRFLQKGFSPYDGSQSRAPQTVLGRPSSQSNGLVMNLFGPSEDAATITGRPVLTTFFNPSTNNLLTSNSGVNNFNMAVIFHEGLHGFTGMDDLTLQQSLNCFTQDPLQTHNITNYVSQFVLVPPPSPIEQCQ